MTKKILSVFLAILMTFVVMPTVTFAEDDHTHCICGGENSVGDHTAHTNVTWTGVSSLSEITDAGNYYLKNDVTLGDTWTCSIDGVNLCLNGKTVTGTMQWKEVINISTGASLAITDCQETVGKITTNNIYSFSGVINYGILTLWNGSIAGVKTGTGGGVRNSGTFTMNGGSIENNEHGGGGGGVANSGTFTMNGGSITGNRAPDGGGVENYGTFTMTGGSITLNTSSAGRGGGVFNAGTFKMSGGTITGNTDGDGGVFNLGTFTVSGDVNISGNTNEPQTVPINVRLYDESTVTVEEGKPLAATARIGITAENPASNPTVVTGTTSVRGFYSDDANYSLVSNGSGGLKLTAGHTHCICGNENSVGDHTTHTNVTWTGISSFSEITAEGNYYLKNDVTLGGTWTCSIAGVNLCLNGKTISGTMMPEEAINISTGASLAITDCQETVGKITKNKNDGTFICNRGILTLWNGSITGNRRGVRNDGTFTMNGGSITGNDSRGGIYNVSTFTMNGGSITDNKNTGFGGGVENYGTFTMTGGSITQNYAGIHGGGVTNRGTFTMTGGSITGNNNDGIYNNDGSTVKLSGNVNISGNVKGGTLKNGVYTGGTPSNVYLYNGTTITVESGKPLAATAKVGITAENPASYPTVVTGTTSTTGFFSDNANYQLIDNGSNGLLLAEVITFSGVKLLNETGGEEMTGGKIYDGKAVAYDDSGVSYTPTVSDVSLTYTWQKLNGETYSDLTAAPKAAGSYRLLVSAVKNGYTLGTQSLEFTIGEYHPTGEEYSVNSNDWLNVDFVVTAAEGWQLSLTNTAEGNWVSTLTVSEENNNGTLEFYLKNTSTGAISEKVTEHYKIDKTPPVISGIEDGKFYCEDVTITAEDENFKEFRINGISQGPAAVTVLPVEAWGSQIRVTAVDKAGNITGVTVNIGHDWGDWVSNGDDTHTRVCKVNSEHTETDDCHGGAATCTDRAICDDCKQPYGELAPHNHTNLQHFPANEATKEAEGNIEYWYCDACDRYYSDEDGTMEIQKSDTVIEKLKDDSQKEKYCELFRLILRAVLIYTVYAVVIGITAITTIFRIIINHIM